MSIPYCTTTLGVATMSKTYRTFGSAERSRYAKGHMDDIGYESSQKDLGLMT